MNSSLARSIDTDECPRQCILVVDDDPMARKMIGKALSRAGFIITEACNGEQALQRMAEQLPKAVLMDFEMPTMNGVDACKQLRQLYGDHIPVLMVTGHNDVDSVNLAYEAGATDFTEKPINLPVLAHRVRYLLRTSQVVSELASTIAELDKSRAKLKSLAYYDALTHLPNRESFMRQLNQQLKTSKPLAVMFLDVDNFKRVNDTLGHRIGDLLLQTMAKRLHSSVRNTDVVYGPGNIEQQSADSVVARFGGDEFTVLLGDVSNAHDAALVAQRILDALAQPMQLAGYEMVISPSIGIALHPDNGIDADTLLKNADSAMYEAKHSGKNHYRFYNEPLGQQIRNDLTLETELRKAITDGDLILHYQPQLEVSTGRVLGVEALVRWCSKDRGMVSPADFIPLAETTGLILPLGEWILNRACTDMARWCNQGLPIDMLAVNISARQFMEPEFVQQVKSILNTTGLPANRLELEITESLLMHNVDQAVNVLQDFSDAGISLSIDDFGTGYSSLSYLKRFPISRLKIDKAFVHDILTSPEDAAITSAVIAMARSLGLSVIAEGVESEEQLRFLKNLECNEVQGFLVSRPLPAEDIELFVRSRYSTGV